MTIGEKLSRLANLSDARRRIPCLVVALSMCGGLASVANVAHADVVVVDVVAVADGVRVNEIKGKAVYNEANERIGSLDDLIIGRGRVLFAILQVGGFLRLGSHYVAVPYEALQFSGGASPKTTLPGATKQERNPCRILSIESDGFDRRNSDLGSPATQKNPTLYSVFHDMVSV